MDAAALIHALLVLNYRYEKAAVNPGSFGSSGACSYLVGMAGHKVSG